MTSAKDFGLYRILVAETDITDQNWIPINSLQYSSGLCHPEPGAARACRNSRHHGSATNRESPTATSAEDLKVYGRLAEDMTWYHTHIRTTWDKLYRGTEADAIEPSDRNLVALGLSFCNQLQTHHDIEEMYWFPKLGEKMEGFRPGHFASEQHKEMHRGLDVLRAHLNECWSGLRTLERREVRSILDSFGGVLWKHMAEEVQQLSAENMAKYWTREEMNHLVIILA
ncbi:hypothetical protein MBLNU457_2019t1 [Dothideomycetes sp. NU457]